MNKADPLIDHLNSLPKMRDKEIVTHKSKGTYIMLKSNPKSLQFKYNTVTHLARYCHIIVVLLFQIQLHLQVCLSTHQAQNVLLTTVQARKLMVRIAKDLTTVDGASSIRVYVTNMT